MLQDGVRPGSDQPVVKQRQGDVELAGAACGVLAKDSSAARRELLQAAGQLLNESHAPGSLPSPVNPQGTALAGRTFKCSPRRRPDAGERHGTINQSLSGASSDGLLADVSLREIHFNAWF